MMSERLSHCYLAIFTVLIIAYQTHFFRCATTKGSFVNASVFALVEEEYLSNDDKILATAMAVSKTAKSEQCTGEHGLLFFVKAKLILNQF